VFLANFFSIVLKDTSTHVQLVFSYHCASRI